MQTVVVMITNALADGDYDTAARMTRGRRLSAADLEKAVRDYGKTLIRMPPAALDDLEIYEVANAELPTFRVVVDLWTEEEGRSDLTLELELVDRYKGAYDTVILDLHML